MKMMELHSNPMRVSRVRRWLVLPDRSRRTTTITRTEEKIGYCSKRADHFLVSAIRNVVAMRSYRLPSITRTRAMPTTTIGEAHSMPLTMFHRVTSQFATTAGHRLYHGICCRRPFLQVSQIWRLHSTSHTSPWLLSLPPPPIRKNSTNSRMLTLLKDSPDKYPPGSLSVSLIRDIKLSIVSLTEVVSTRESKKKNNKTRLKASKSKSTRQWKKAITTTRVMKGTIIMKDLKD